MTWRARDAILHDRRGQVLIEALVTWITLSCILLGTWKLFRHQLNQLEFLEQKFHSFQK